MGVWFLIGFATLAAMHLFLVVVNVSCGVWHGKDGNEQVTTTWMRNIIYERWVFLCFSLGGMLCCHVCLLQSMSLTDFQPPATEEVFPTG